MAVVLEDWQKQRPISRERRNWSQMLSRPKSCRSRFGIAMPWMTPGVARASRRRENLREDLPDSRILMTLILDALFRSDRDEEALTEADSLIQDYPALQEFYRARLQILARLGREEEMETTLRDMIERFPEDEESKSLLVRYYLSRNDLDSAENFLRDQAETEGENQDARRLTLVRFLRDARGRQAALAEIDGFSRTGPTPRVPAMRAALRFETGDHDEAISDLQALVEEADPSEQTRENKVLLATFQQATGNEVRARQLVEEVLAEEPGMFAALKMRAGWQIEDDRSEEAVNTLRAALNEAPDDTEALTMLANAHMRNGSQQLAGDTLAQAVRASSNAPDESRRYADFLVADEKGVLAPRPC